MPESKVIPIGIKNTRYVAIDNDRRPVIYREVLDNNGNVKNRLLMSSLKELTVDPEFIIGFNDTFDDKLIILNMVEVIAIVELARGVKIDHLGIILGLENFLMTNLVTIKLPRAPVPKLEDFELTELGIAFCKERAQSLHYTILAWALSHALNKQLTSTEAEFLTKIYLNRTKTAREQQVDRFVKFKLVTKDEGGTLKLTPKAIAGFKVVLTQISLEKTWPIDSIEFIAPVV